MRVPLALPHCAAPHALPRTLPQYTARPPQHFRSHMCGSLRPRHAGLCLHTMVAGLFLFGMRAAATSSHAPGKLLARTCEPSHSAWSLPRPHTALHAQPSPSAIRCLSCSCPSRAQVARHDQDLDAVDSKQIVCAIFGARCPCARVCGRVQASSAQRVPGRLPCARPPMHLNREAL
jgi:hypothetical protein